MPYDTLADQLLQAQIRLELGHLPHYEIGHPSLHTPILKLLLRSTLHAPALLYLEEQHTMPRVQSNNVWEAGGLARLATLRQRAAPKAQGLQESLTRVLHIAFPLEP